MSNLNNWGYNAYQKKVLNQGAIHNICCINRLFNKEVTHWMAGKYKIKLLILAEAPLSCGQYFYGENQGNFLLSIRDYFKLTQIQVLPTLSEEGVFVLDIYEFPIDASLYDADKRSHHLFNDQYLRLKLDLLRRKGLLSDDAHLVFRYKKLINRYLDMKKQGIITGSLDSIPYTQWIFGSLNMSERPQVMSPVLKAYI